MNVGDTISFYLADCRGVPSTGKIEKVVPRKWMGEEYFELWVRETRTKEIYIINDDKLA